MTTKHLAKLGPVTAVSVLKAPKKKTGRRGRPPNPFAGCACLTIPHPLHPWRCDAGITEEQAMRWTGRSRQTVRRWVALGHCPDVGLARLLALYAHGMMPIRPEHYRHPDAPEWALMRFRLDDQRPLRRKTESPADRYQMALYTYHSNRPLNWVQIDAAGMTLAMAMDRDRELGCWKARARAAEAEAARLRDLVAYQ